MSKPANLFHYFNSPPEIIRLAVMMYARYPLSLRNEEGSVVRARDRHLSRDGAALVEQVRSDLRLGLPEAPAATFLQGVQLQASCRSGLQQCSELTQSVNFSVGRLDRDMNSAYVGPSLCDGERVLCALCTDRRGTVSVVRRYDVGHERSLTFP